MAIELLTHRSQGVFNKTIHDGDYEVSTSFGSSRVAFSLLYCQVNFRKWTFQFILYSFFTHVAELLVPCFSF